MAAGLKRSGPADLVGPFLIALVSGAVFLAGRTWALPFDRDLALFIYYPALGVTFGNAARFAAERWPDRPWTIRGVGTAASALALAAGGGLHPAQSWRYVIWVVGAMALLVLGYRATSDAIAGITRNVRTLRTRLLVLTLTSASLMAAVMIYRPFMSGPESSSESLLLVAMLLALPMTVGFAATVAERLTLRLERTAEAMRRVAAGSLEVNIADEGRDEVAEVGRAFNQMMEGLREKEFVERAFGRYVAPDILAELRTRKALEIATERREASVLYADIRGFTTFSEQASPEEVMRVLNLYFSRMLEVIAANGGYVNKFIGDAVMVVFNAPSDQPDHAARAVACARAMQHGLAAMNAAGAFGPERRLEIGIGVNTGPLVAGSLGGQGRAEYTVIGDTVNVAARLTSKAQPGEILVGAATAKESGVAGLSPLAPLTVKGKSQPLEVYGAAWSQPGP